MTNEELIQDMKDHITRGEYEGYALTNEECKQVIQALEQQRWILVSERLPEESGEYLVYMIWGDEEPTYSIINFDADYNEFGEWIEHYDINTLGVIDREFRTYIDVFAWCPLPEPYKECDTDEHN